MNKVVLIGRITKDPELKFTPGNGTGVCALTLAVDRRKKEDGADFIPVVVWGKQAENTATYTAKGSLIGVAGRISTRSYEDKQGNKRYVTEVIADEIQFLDKKGTSAPVGIGNSDIDFEMQLEEGSEIPF